LLLETDSPKIESVSKTDKVDASLINTVKTDSGSSSAPKMKAIVELSAEADEKLASKISKIIEVRAEKIEKSDQFQIKVILRPENIGRVIIKVQIDKENGKVRASFEGNKKAVAIIQKNASVISEKISSSGLNFAGFSFKSKKDELDNAKKEAKKDDKNKESDESEQQSLGLSQNKGV